ncbi:MAG TPA: helix-turn-helix domain-containing protein [Desulfuromonadaceae bacterium]
MHKERRLLTAQTAEKTLELLEILAGGNERLTIGNLAARLDMGRTKTLLLLVTLESRGMVRWDEQARVYRPGQKTTELARHVLGSALPHAEQKSARALPAVTRKLRSDRRYEVGGRAAGAP